MAPPTHPDATAFAARFLANPDDRLGPLVFADWLDDRGDDSSVAWARYLQYVAVIKEEFGCEIAHQAESLGQGVRAQLTLGGVPGTSLLSRLHLFLPAERVWVRIGETKIPRAVLSWYPESLARLHGFMPIGTSGERLIAVVEDGERASFDPVRADVENFLRIPMTAFRVETRGVQSAINSHYSAEVVSVGRMLRAPDSEAD